MIESLLAMYEGGALTGYQVMIDCLHQLDPANPDLILTGLPPEILGEMLDYAHRYDPHRPRSASPIFPAEDQVRAAERWISEYQTANADTEIGVNSNGRPN